MTYQPEPRGDVKRLPKWAQEYISGLETAIVNQKSHIADISAGHPGTNVVLDSSIGHPEMTLAKDSLIRFYLGTGRDALHDVIEVNHDRRDNRILHVRGNGNGPLLVIPWATNSIRITVGER